MEETKTIETVKEEVVEKTDVEKRREEYLALKEENDNVEAELLRREKLKIETNLGGVGGGHVEPVAPEPISDVEFAKKVMNGELNPLKMDGLL